MDHSSGNSSVIHWMQYFTKDYMFPLGEHGLYGILIVVSLGIIIPFLLSSLAMDKKSKRRAEQVDFGGEAGLIIRNKRFPTLVEVPWEGADTMAALFEHSCRKYAGNKFLGTRKLISREMEAAGGGRKFEKLHLGDYEWVTYGVAYDRACNFASGLAKLGHSPDSPAAIFSETRAEWLLALQVKLQWDIDQVCRTPLF